MNKIASIFAVSVCLIGVPANAMQCNSPSELVAVAKASSTRSSIAQVCAIQNEKAIHLGANLASSLVRARGYVEAIFFDSSGRKLWSSRRGPWLGAFSGLALDETFPVPAGASQIRVTAAAESTMSDAAGEWRVQGLSVTAGLMARLETRDGTVVVGNQPSHWVLASPPGSPAANVRIEFIQLSGEIAQTRTEGLLAGGGELTLAAPPLPVGYYDVRLIIKADALEPSTLHSSLVVLPADKPEMERRFGMDAALSWYGGTPEMISRSADMMRLAGVGSVRDRMSWNNVQPKPLGKSNWGRHIEIADAMANAGIDTVQVFHDSPPWSRGASQGAADRQPPTDDGAVFAFGRSYALGLGKVVRNIEFWNEQNSDFYLGYPFQYAQSLKAFSAGVKSVDPGIQVLIGAASGQPGRFFEETYRNGTAGHFDTRNQHFYGKDADLQSFLPTYVKPIEQQGAVAGRPGWITEMGFSLRRDSKGDWRSSEIEQAHYLVKTYAAGFASGYERVFFFFWRELVEAELHTWGLIRGDFSARPAYLALSLLTRHLAGATLVATETHSKGQTVYFRKPTGDYVAVSWGGAGIARLGKTVSATDIFGKPISGESQTSVGDAPIFLAGIFSLPPAVRLVSLPTRSQLLPQAPLRISAKLHVAGSPVDARGKNRIAVSVGDGETVEIIGHIFAGNPFASDGIVAINCSGGAGLTALSPEQLSFENIGVDGRAFACRFRSVISSIGESYVSAIAMQNNQSDVVRIALIPDAARSQYAGVRSFRPTGACPKWSSRASDNVNLSTSEKPSLATPCPATVVLSSVTKSGETWVFPAAIVKGADFMGTSGMQFKLGHVQGVTPPPMPVLLQLVERTGGIWLVDLVPRTGGAVTGLFNLARPADWARDDNGRLDLGNVKEIMIGWGGYGGETGQRHAFSIESIELLKIGR